MPRHYRRRSRMSSLGNVIRSYKKVLDFAPASRVASTVIEFEMTSGVDSIGPGQGGVSDPTVPTGAMVKGFNIDIPFGYTGTATAFIWMSIQHLRANQSVISPRVIGGNSQRNQVFFQKLVMLGENQNLSFHMRFKIPPKFQRVREGDKWIFAYESDVAHASGAQIIYKLFT